MKVKCLLFFIFPIIAFSAEIFNETFYFQPSWYQTFEVKEVLFHEKNELQDLIIFENEDFGRVLALDGIIQTTEKDEFIYHEMLVHIPMMTHPKPKNILIIGGGDGGSLREVLRHETVEKVTMVEIDRSVIELCEKYLPNHSQGAFHHEKAHIVIDDGAKFVRDTNEKFDVIICDSTDPIGPGEVLFDVPFYRDCFNCLNKGGLFVSQNGVPTIQADELEESHAKLSLVFPEVHHFVAPIPTYVGGFMVFSLSSYQEVVKEPSRKLSIQNLKYHTEEIHRASFALPRYISP